MKTEIKLNDLTFYSILSDEQKNVTNQILGIVDGLSCREISDITLAIGAVTKAKSHFYLVESPQL